MTKYGQYCDEVQMSKIRLTEKETISIKTDDGESSIIHENEPEPYIINVENIENEDTMLSEELKSKKMFFDQFGQAVFGQVSSKLIFRVNQKSIKNV